MKAASSASKIAHEIFGDSPTTRILSRASTSAAIPPLNLPITTINPTVFIPDFANMADEVYEGAIGIDLGKHFANTLGHHALRIGVMYSCIKPC